MSQTAQADTYGLFTYTDNGTTITITDYPTAETGSVVIPSEIAGKPVTALGFQAFADCSGLTSVTIPPGVTSVGDGVFLNCTGLTSAALPSGVTSLGSQAFAYCSGLVSMVVPNGITAIPDNLFVGCTSLVDVTIPSGVTSIGNTAFNNCVSLSSVALPPALISLGVNAFSDCAKLSSVTLPSTVTSIGASAFARCGALVSVVVSSGMVVIPTSAFEDCSAMTTVTIPVGVTTIQATAFRRCTALVSVTIPSSVTSIATDSFSRCYGLTSISVDAANSAFSSSGGVLFNKAQTTLVTYPAGLSGAYVVPSGVSTIGNNAFRFASVLTSVSVPASVGSIGTDAFGSCPMLTAISVNASNAGFSSLNGVLFNKAQTILRSYPTGLAGSYVIPSTVITINSAAFRSSLGLTAVTIPASVTTINSDAFATCSQLTSATFEGNAPTSFGARVFQSAAANFKIWCHADATGFTFPLWQGYPSALLGNDIATWLQNHGLPADSDVASDSNGDGVSLLMAYALNLDPNQNLVESLPAPIFSANQMSMSFYAGSVGVTYVVQASADLKSWSAEGVSISPPDSNQVRTATVDKIGPFRFMRLVVSH